ncbi:lysosomal-associated transmembrane protein 4a [Plakobranchus ocellatus]|uniref:Lysosomal-associated transmembrane protein 4a n=1 Tax=Plakobranchus ocellatus TaxID=259542 RepID=A0AAV4CXR3_9GAST|nr:lysosomal-associated transmembrane protein 4a [Plakobranchus ocellatus]
MDDKPHNTISGIDPKNFRCCICFHVKTGTVIYGIFIATVQFIVLGLLILASIRPDVLKPVNQQPYDGIVVVQTDQGDFFQDHAEATREQQLVKDNLCTMFGVTLIFLIASISLIYGVGKNRAVYLVPFFGLQVFDFCLTCLTVVGGFTYATNIKQWIHEQRLDHLPGMNHLMCLNSEYLTLLFIMGLLMMLSIKAYLIGMVWSCYKYIQMHVASRSVVREYSVDPDTEQMLLPPRYEDVIKVNPNNPAVTAYVSE